jgi:hypothetical protein
MTNKQMNFQDYSVSKPTNEWFEDSCRVWAEYYSFLLGLSIWDDAEKAWIQDQFNFNKIYDV